MRCKVGDLAVIVKSAQPENLGAVVLIKCRYFIPSPYPYEDFGTSWRGRYMHGVLWHVIAQGRPILTSITRTPCRERMYADSNLRPLRADEGEDEVLRITGKPQETPTEIVRRESERVS